MKRVRFHLAYDVDECQSKNKHSKYSWVFVLTEDVFSNGSTEHDKDDCYQYKCEK